VSIGSSPVLRFYETKTRQLVGGEEAPSGMGVFGRYDVISSFADDENKYPEVQWAYEVTEDW
jgi:RHO protein GDP dissociation inhibitor.